MSTTYDVLPDAVLLARSWLASHAAVVALVVDRISTQLPPTFDPRCAYLTVQRIGGVPVNAHRIDAARIQVSAWAPSEETSSLVARTARAALHAMQGTATPDGVTTGVTDDLGLTWAPDTTRTPPTPRHIFGVVLYTHAA